MSKKLYIVHAVDAEGPMYESIKETIKRFNSLLKLPKKIKTPLELKNALNGKLFSSKINKIISKNFNSHLLNYNAVNAQGRDDVVPYLSVNRSGFVGRG